MQPLLWMVEDQHCLRGCDGSLEQGFPGLALLYSGSHLVVLVLLSSLGWEVLPLQFVLASPLM